MNLPQFIAQRIRNSKEGSLGGTIHGIAVASIAIGLGIMIISYLILGGFQEQIKQKIYTFGGHLQVTKYTLNNSLEEQPISKATPFYEHYEKYPFVKHVQVFAHKPGLLKADEGIQGVVFKGVGKEYDSTAFDQNIQEGHFPHFPKEGYSEEVVISRYIANRLRLKLGDKVLMYFVQNPPRYRQLKIVGIYETGMEDFDKRIIVGDIRLIQRINGWAKEFVGGYEVFIQNPDQVDQAEDQLNDLVASDQYVRATKHMYPQVFDWLHLLGKNVKIFLGLILFVAAFNMVAIILIIIMDRTQLIGTLMALGAPFSKIRAIFVRYGIALVGKGLLWGNAFAFLFGIVQGHFHLIPLDPENYYMSYVPIAWHWDIILGLNLLVGVTVSMVLFVPAYVISRMQPIRAIRFD